jgi:hypothetical protein
LFISSNRGSLEARTYDDNVFSVDDSNVSVAQSRMATTYVNIKPAEDDILSVRRTARELEAQHTSMDPG